MTRGRDSLDLVFDPVDAERGRARDLEDHFDRLAEHSSLTTYELQAELGHLTEDERDWLLTR